ncbi:OmpA family protein [Gramella sp. AN32]|uniref:OmpA family protein n=1 Tax=Christiangramia antarctica TaxID=2058158 RepID=A0ABW5X3Y2_9FLAO|nr:OmpA family protein [Gramella sp. AN32]MCM4158036.1 flagellar motor protein MotB [Gramella sp. AN32]
MRKYYYLFIIFFALPVLTQAQSGKQKKADKLFKEFAYLEATDVYKELIEKDYHVSENSKKLGDAYMMLRSPENAVFYYGDVIEEEGISPEYYYKYAQALRGVKRYDESREYLQKYLDSGRESNDIEEMIEGAEFRNMIIYKLKNGGFNSEMSDFGVFEKDGKIYFVSARAQGIAEKDKIYSWNGEPFLDVYITDSTGTVSPVTGDINTKLHDGPVVISPDGNTMYFTRNNFLDNKEGKKDKERTNHLKLYSATKTGAEWKEVKEIPFNSNDYSIGHPSLSADGKTLYFTSDMPGGIGGTDIYKVAINEDKTFGAPENLGEPVNTEFDETFPFMDADGILYFSSNGHPGLGLFDIFRIDLDEDAIVENLGEPMNSNLDDFAYFQVSDSKEGYISTNREGGSDNIMSFNKLNPLTLKGTVTDAVNGEPIAAATLRLMDENNEQIVFLETNEDGYYETIVAREKQLPIEAKEIKYETFNGTVNTVNQDDHEELIYDIQLDPIADVEYLAEIDNIYFDFDKSNIRPDAATELDKLVNLMQNTYPKLVIAIGSHTDRRGSNAYNEKLAERRAKSTYDYLISKGISAERIQEYKGFGETKPAIDCERCSEKDHQLNRRSMFSVVEMKN